MNKNINNKEITRFLEERHFSAGIIDTLKVRYRSLICPFIDLIGKVNHGDKVGDVGCGSGQFLLLLSEFATPSYFYGIEINDRLINNAKTLFNKFGQLQYNFETYDGENFPVALEEMDTVFLIDVLHHVPAKKQQAFLKNLSEKIKRGSRLILKDINAGSPLVYFNKMHDLIFSREIGNEISMQKAIKLLEENGFEIIEQKKQRMYVYPHYTLVARKK